jgi:hypothetical protein
MYRDVPLIASVIVSRLESTVTAGNELIQQLCTTSSQSHLDVLYAHVLSICSEGTGAYVSKLLGTIALLDVHATPSLLATLLQLPRHEVAELLQALVNARLLMTDIPLVSIANTTPLHLCHDSLRDFIVDPLRCRVKQCLVSPMDIHKAILDRCLSLLNEHLRQDICEIRKPWIANEDVPDLPDRIERSLPEAVRYACVSWPVHLIAAGSMSETESAALLDFCTVHLLHWLEALSLLGELPSTLKHLPVIIEWCQVRTYDCQ